MAYTMASTVDLDRTKRQIVEEFRRWKKGGYGSSDVSEHDFPMRLDRNDTNASVRFVLRGKPITVECNSQYYLRDNMRCIFYAVHAMRMNEKRGIADTMANAYLQLNAPATTRDPYEVLGLRPDADMALVEVAHKTLAKTRHPDKGGSDEAMKELNEAFEHIREDREA